MVFIGRELFWMDVLKEQVGARAGAGVGGGASLLKHASRSTLETLGFKPRTLPQPLSCPHIIKDFILSYFKIYNVENEEQKCNCLLITHSVCVQI